MSDEEDTLSFLGDLSDEKIVETLADNMEYFKTEGGYTDENGDYQLYKTESAEAVWEIRVYDEDVEVTRIAKDPGLKDFSARSINGCLERGWGDDPDGGISASSGQVGRKDGKYSLE